VLSSAAVAAVQSTQLLNSVVIPKPEVLGLDKTTLRWKKVRYIVADSQVIILKDSFFFWILG